MNSILKYSKYIIILIGIFLFPLLVNAETHSIIDTDISITFDEKEWYVFTRDNIENNKELDELGITYDYMYDFMYNNYVYLDSVLFYENSDETIEFFVRKKEVNDIKNLINYSDTDVRELAHEISKRQNIANYDIYTNKYKYAYLNYIDSDYHLIEYYTIVNGQAYTLTIQKKADFTEIEKEKIKNIIDSIEFNIDYNLKENFNDKSDIITDAIIGAIVGAIIFSLVALLNNRKKAKSNRNMN